MKRNLVFLLVILFSSSALANLRCAEILSGNPLESILIESLSNTTEVFNREGERVNSGELTEPVKKNFEFASNLAVEGALGSLRLDSNGAIAYMGFVGPTSLNKSKKQGGEILPGQGVGQHEAGFGTPVGSIKNVKNAGVTKKAEKGKSIVDYTDSDFKELGIIPGEKIEIEYGSGVLIEGKLLAIERVSIDGKEIPAILKFEAGTATVTYGEVRLFEPEWGEFDLYLGSNRLLSVSP